MLRTPGIFLGIYKINYYVQLTIPKFTKWVLKDFLCILIYIVSSVRSHCFKWSLKNWRMMAKVLLISLGKVIESNVLHGQSPDDTVWKINILYTISIILITFNIPLLLPLILLRFDCLFEAHSWYTITNQIIQMKQINILSILTMNLKYIVYNQLLYNQLG